ncbi:MAG: hypothetical protein FJX34_02395 [Alphaproteobacteria bacterium]|nr:hypothetical protein [Alphaproteobacteria bacterium]
MIKKEVWILVDSRPGTASQAIGLAEEIGLDYRIINLEYGFLSLLPNIFLSDSILRLNQKSRKIINELDYFPSLIISAGRRSAPIALYLKNKSQNQTNLIQIMNPNLDFKKFDLVILPKHDGYAEGDYPNLITTIGSLTKARIGNGQEFLELRNIRRTKIALLIGGSSNKTKFTTESAQKLAKISSKIAQEKNAILLILNSRRTSRDITEAVKSGLECDHQFFGWSEVKNNNPYLSILNLADYFIITGDSVSMISECCSTGKPVYIFDEKDISSAKHRRFHQELFLKNYAKPLNEKFDNFFPLKLQETKHVAEVVKKKLVD